MSKSILKLSHHSLKNIVELAVLLFLGLSTTDVLGITLFAIALGLIFSKPSKKYADTKKVNKPLRFNLSQMVPSIIGSKMTPIERKMYHALKRAGYNPIPQYQQGRYRLDLALFERNLKLDIECDGKAYHSSPEQRAHDRKRTRSLNKEGWNIIRFSGSQIHRNVGQCVEMIERKIKRIT